MNFKEKESNGRFVLEPVFDREAILIAEIDLIAIDRENTTS